MKAGLGGEGWGRRSPSGSSDSPAMRWEALQDFKQISPNGYPAWMAVVELETGGAGSWRGDGQPRAQGVSSGGLLARSGPHSRARGSRGLSRVTVKKVRLRTAAGWRAEGRVPGGAASAPASRKGSGPGAAGRCCGG